MAENGLEQSYSLHHECGSDSTRNCSWTADGDWEMPAVEGLRIARNPRIQPWIIDEEKEWKVEEPKKKDKEADKDEACGAKVNFLNIEDIYPVISLINHPPLPYEFRKEYCDDDDDDLEEWASQPQRDREAQEGMLTFLLLRRGLSDFSYSTYGFKRLNLSQSALSDISLFLFLPSTFPSLTHLNLSYNKLTDISPLSALSTITHLDVSHNKLKKLLFMYPEWYWNVDEPHSKAKDSAYRTLAQLSSMGWALCGPATSPLQWVNYSYNLVTKLEGERHWAHYPRLAYLNLSHNRISDTRSEGRQSSIEGQQQSNSETSSAECGLANLNILHTLDLSHNYIRRVEGLNGLKAHKLVLTGNSISSWEETPPKKWSEQPPDAEELTTEEPSCPEEKQQSQVNGPKEGDEPLGKEETAGSKQRKRKKIMMIKIGRKEGKKEEKAMEEKVERKEVERKDSMESSKELETIYRFDEKKKVKETPLDTLYVVPDAQWTRRESAQEDNDDLKEWLKEDNIFRNWYDTDMKLIYHSGRVNYSEESKNDSSSTEGRIPPEPQKSPKHSDNSEQRCEVLFERSLEILTEEESGETFERVSEDSQVRVLFEGLEIQGDDGVSGDYEEEAVKCRKREENRLLYMKGEVPYEEKRLNADESVETLFVRGPSTAEVQRSISSDRQLDKVKKNGGAPEVTGAEDTSDDSVKNVRKVSFEAEPGNVADSGEESKPEGSDVIKNGDVSKGETNSREEKWLYAYKIVSSSSEEDSSLNLGTQKDENSDSSNELQDLNEMKGAEKSNDLEEPIGHQAKIESQVEIRVGLRTLLYLDELHLENNCISSLSMFQGMYCLRCLFIQHNQIEGIGELIFLSELQNLQHLDMTGNPVTKREGFEDLVHLLHPYLKSLNGIDCHNTAKALKAKPIKMCWKNPFFRAKRQYEDILLETELLQGHHGDWHSPVTEYLDRLGAPFPVLLLVGPQGFWKESLCRKLCKILSDMVYVSPLCTTDQWFMKEENFYSCRYVPLEKFFSMLRTGELVSASQDGFSFVGLEKRHLEEAVRRGKVLVSVVDLESALVLRGSGFGGAPRLVLVLPGKKQEEEMLEEWRRRIGKKVTGIAEWEEELRREWTESNEEYLNTHQQNPGLFEFGLSYEEGYDALEKIKNLVLEMLNDRAKHSSFDSQEKVASYQSEGVSESMMQLIDERLKKELDSGIEIW